ncbi:hypothetical protein F511_22518 [Dorcoceras hygrometricum]|uniref:SAM domain-containing protein n=1 Tax=Dorcoceras hygrometricum TaxID=472368 RepID=A0A2Z7CHD7_9LAMI|nr:hypothetical protein F511_22518 [Dorcoceras hygrometricum]
MDWFAWLSKTNLDRSLVYDYAVMFTYNELEEDDILHFNHEFLQSMGVAIAKHRLEILKLARKEKGGRSMIRRLDILMFAIKKTKNYLSRKVEALTHHRDNSSLSLVKVGNSSLRWKVSMLQRNKRRFKWASAEVTGERNESPRIGFGEKILMIGYKDPHDTDNEGSSTIRTQSSSTETKVNPAWNSSFSSALGPQSLDGECWSSSMEDNKWDSMFADLRPT